MCLLVVSYYLTDELFPHLLYFNHYLSFTGSQFPAVILQWISIAVILRASKCWLWFPDIIHWLSTSMSSLLGTVYSVSSWSIRFSQCRHLMPHITAQLRCMLHSCFITVCCVDQDYSLPSICCHWMLSSYAVDTLRFSIGCNRLQLIESKSSVCPTLWP